VFICVKLFRIIQNGRSKVEFLFEPGRKSIPKYLARAGAFRILLVMPERAVPNLNKPDVALEMTLRPSLFSEFTGQPKVKERLEIAVAAAKNGRSRSTTFLLNGPPGLGKTTLASILAKAMGANFKSTSGPTIEKAGDLAGLLTNLEEGDVLFIDEIHRLQKTIEEYLYPRWRISNWTSSLTRGRTRAACG